MPSSAWAGAIRDLHSFPTRRSSDLDVRDALEGLLEPTFHEKVLGRAEVRQVFAVSGIGQVAGCAVTDGKIIRGAKARLLRDHVVVQDRKSTRLNSSHTVISYAVFCLGRRHPRSTLFPYTTLFRSRRARRARRPP